MACYAFKKGGKEETFGQHSSDALKCLRNCFPNLPYVVQSKLNINNVDDIRKAIEIAVGFHDIGKTLEVYQKNIGDLSFYGHEFVGAYIIDSLINKLAGNLPDELKVLVYMIILQHHHAMRPIKDWVSSLNLEKLKDIIDQNSKVYDECLNELTSVAKLIDPKLSNPFNIPISPNDLEKFRENLLSTLNLSPGLQSSLSIILTATVMCDYCSATKNREGNKKSPLIEQLCRICPSAPCCNTT